MTILSKYQAVIGRLDTPPKNSTLPFGSFALVSLGDWFLAVWPFGSLVGTS
jgi:hypothetical protein